MKEIKILHIFGKMHHGGAEMRTVDIMRHINREKYKFNFCSLSGLKGSFDTEIRKMGGEVFYCKVNSLLFPIKFIRLLRKERFDIVHSHVHYFSGFIVFLAYIAGIKKRIVHFRNTNDDGKNNIRKRVQRKIMKYLINKYATNILAVNHGSMEIAWRKNWRSDSRCKVVYNGIDVKRQLSNCIEEKTVREEFKIEQNWDIIIHVGRMVEQKNHIRVIEIFNEIYKLRPSSILLLVGKGDNSIEQQIRRKIKELNIEENVILAGTRDDVPRLMESANLLLFPSKWEGLPGVVLEASAVGIPTLASDIPGIREIAEWISSVKYMELKCSNYEWAKSALSIIDFYKTQTKKSLKEDFAKSPFKLEKCINELAKVWNQ